MPQRINNSNNSKTNLGRSYKYHKNNGIYNRTTRKRFKVAENFGTKAMKV
jgi:hypothetical protein